MSEPWDWPGSRWWRVDLHCHSPASYDFWPDQAPSASNSIRWLEAARDAGLHAVAITDHNTAAGIEPLQTAAEQVENPPVLFPGVELTAADGSHLLLVIDQAHGRTDIEDLLSKFEVPVGNRGNEDSRSPQSVEQILEHCGNDVVVIAAHANGERGLLEHDGQQRIKELQNPRLLAAEVKPDLEIDTSWLDGSRPEIGRRIPEIHASDSHNLDDIGRRYTWVKMTRPDLEGLRLALLDGSGSVHKANKGDAFDPNQHQAAHAIESIKVDDAKYIGRPSPIQIDLNPWLNTIIGGRGTGKSTLVDFFRKTLRREAELRRVEPREDGALHKHFDRRMRVPPKRHFEGLLTKDTKIEVVYRKDSTRFSLAWNQDGDAHPITLIDENEKRSEEGDIRERFPVRIYSQKQLFAIAQNPKALLTVIDDSPKVNGADLRRRMDELKDQYLALRAQARSEARKARERPHRTAVLADIQQKLNLLEKGGHTQILNDYRRRSQLHSTWSAILDLSESTLETVERSVEDLTVPDLEDRNDNVHNEHHLTRMHTALLQIIEDARSELRKVVRKARRDVMAVRSGPDAEKWQTSLGTSHRELEIVNAELAAEGISDPNDYKGLVAEEAKLRREIETLVNSQTLAEDLENKASEVLADYRKLRQELSDRRCHFARETSSDTIKVEVRPYGDTTNLVDYLGDQIGTERFEKDREALSSRIAPDESMRWDWRRLDQVVGDISSVLGGSSAPWNLRHGRFEQKLQQMGPERLDHISLYPPEDDVTVGFRDHTKTRWRPLEQGSPGQQTAALLAFVLGYGTEPIILDQPEDDLDNTLIYDLLVTSLRQTKQSRQIIVVTHNPNIVVHGDAELVISLESRGGKSHVNSMGGLQESNVRAEVCRVMEGGQEAFESRYRRIMPQTT